LIRHRQAKFIADPIITEYVNRVAQNLVLHSDAKAIHSSITTTYQSITAIH
jgi:predicted Zn-dependent protease